MESTNSLKSNLSVKIIVLIIFALINLALFYYFFIFSKKSQFPDIKSSINSQTLLEQGYKKIENFNSKFTYFIPKDWIKINENEEIYGDILTGANAYASISPNNFGKLNSEICTSISKESENKFKELQIYKNIKLINSEIKKLGDYEGCLISFTVKIVNKDYSINQFMVFRKDSIYTITSQYQENLELQKKDSDTILSNLIIN